MCVCVHMCVRVMCVLACASVRVCHVCVCVCDIVFHVTRASVCGLCERACVCVAYVWCAYRCAASKKNSLRTLKKRDPIALHGCTA